MGTRLIAIAFAIAALIVGLTSVVYHKLPSDGAIRLEPVGNGVDRIAWLAPASSAWGAGLRPGDVVAARTVPEGSEVFQAFEVLAGPRAGQLILVGRPWSEASDIAFFLLGLEFLGTGLVVYLLATDRQAAIRFLVLAGATAITMFVTPANGTGHPWALYVEWIGDKSVGAAMALFFLTVPVERWSPLRRAILGLLPPLVALYTYTFLFNPALYDIVKPLGHFYLVISGSVSVAALAWPFVTRTAPEQRKLRAVLLCTGLAVGLFVLGSLAPYLLFGRYWVPPAVAIIGWALVPVGFGWAILWRQLFGLEIVVKRALVYGVMTLLLAGGYYCFVFYGLRALWPARGTATDQLYTNELLFVIFSAAVTLVFAPVRDRVSILVDHLIYRDHYDYVQTLERLERQITQFQPVDQMLADIAERLTRAMNLQGAAVLLRQPDGQLAVRAASGDCRSLDERAPLRAPPGYWIPLLAHSKEYGLLYLGPKRVLTELSTTDRSLAETIAGQMAIAVANTLLVERLEEQVAQLALRERELAALSSRLVSAHEETRRRVALEIHDDPLQRIFLLLRELPPDGSRYDRMARQVLEEVAISLRQITQDLHPPVLDDGGLVPAIEWLTSDFQARTDLAIDLIANPEEIGRLLPELELALYRIVQEALNNVVKHANATAVVVSLRRGAGVWLEVADDGVGLPSGLPPSTSLGLPGMRERLRPWGGTISLVNRPGGGAVLTAIVPRVPAISETPEAASGGR